MAEPITIQKLIEASMDSDSLEVLVNGDENAQVTTRLGETYPSAKKAIKTLFENGGLPATPFATKALMTASALVDGDYAVVTNDADSQKNGLYVKEGSSWSESAFYPMSLIPIKSIYDLKSAVLRGGAEVGDLYYSYIAKKIYKIERIDSKEFGKGQAGPISFVKNAYYAHGNAIYVLVDGAFKQVTGETPTKFKQKIYSTTNFKDAVFNGAKVGDYYLASGISPLLIDEITDEAAGTGHADPDSSLKDEAVFAIDGVIYEFNGSNKTMYPDAELEIVDIYGVIDFADAVVNGGAGIGDVYYNKNAKMFYKIDLLNDSPVGTGHANPLAYESINSNKLYRCQGELYHKVGDELKLVVEQKTADIGEINQLSELLPEESLSAYVNGLKFADELQNPITTLTKQTDNFGHTSSFVFHNDICYATFMVNTRGSGEVPSEMTIRMATFDVASPSNVTHYDICDIGDIVLNKTVTLIYDAAIFLKDGIVHILWNAQLSGDNFYSLLHQTFDPSTSAFSDVTISKFKVKDTTVDLTGDGINTALSAEGIKAPAFSQHIVLMTKASQREESGTTYYYNAIGSATGLNMVIKTTDFMTWEYVAQPSFDNKSQYEPAVYVIGDYVYYYSRQTLDSSFGFLTKYHIPSNVWADPVYISETQSRSQFHVHNGVLYLIYAPRDRHHLGIIEINKTYLEQSKLVQLAKVAGLYMYPEIEEYGGQLYMIFSDGATSVKVSNFTIKSVSESSIDNTFKQLFNI